MVQRAVVVDGNADIAAGATNLIMGNYVGIGAIAYGFYWLVGYYAPQLLAGDVGLLTYLIAPAAILSISARILVALVAR